MSIHLDTLQRPPRQTAPRRVPTGVLRAIRNFRDEAPQLRAWSLRFKDPRARTPVPRRLHPSESPLHPLGARVGGDRLGRVRPDGAGRDRGGRGRDALLHYGSGVPSVLISFGLTFTGAVYECLNDRYRFSDVHVVGLKGKGTTPTRFLLGRSATPVDNGYR